MGIIVTGMHRSGTSLLTSILYKAGISPGEDAQFFSPRPDNPKGYYERKDVWEINEKILKAAQSKWYDILHFDPEKIEIPKETKKEIEKVVNKLNPSPWAIKDPRFSVTLSIWKEFIESPTVIWCIRNPLEVAISLNKRDRFPIQFSLALWHIYNLYLAETIEPEKTIIVDYLQMITAPEETITSLLEHIKSIEGTDIQEPKLSEIVDKTLYRSKILKKRLNRLISKNLKHSWESLSCNTLKRFPNPELSKLSFSEELILSEFPYFVRKIEELSEKISEQHKSYYTLYKLYKNQEKVNEELTNSIENYIAQIKRDYKLNEELMNLIKEKDKQLVELTKQLEKKSKESSSLLSIIDSKNKEIETLLANIKESHTHYKNLLNFYKLLEDKNTKFWEDYSKLMEYTSLKDKEIEKLLNKLKEIYSTLPAEFAKFFD